MGEYWEGKECAQGKDSKISPEGNIEISCSRIYMLFSFRRLTEVEQV